MPAEILNQSTVVSSGEKVR